MTGAGDGLDNGGGDAKNFGNRIRANRLPEMGAPMNHDFFDNRAPLGGSYNGRIAIWWGCRGRGEPSGLPFGRGAQDTEVLWIRTGDDVDGDVLVESNQTPVVLHRQPQQIGVGD